MMVLALLIALYAFIVLAFRVYPEPLAESFLARPWGIYSHAFFAMFALAIGPWQFRGQSLRQRNKWHKTLGKLYLFGALGTTLSGFYMAFYAHGNLFTNFGFGLLAIGLFVTTLIAYLKIRQRAFVEHRQWMIRSYAFMFAAVTLRLWLPFLSAIYGGDFTPAYQWAAWLCWVPNIIWAEWYIVRNRELVEAAIA